MRFVVVAAAAVAAFGGQDPSMRGRAAQAGGDGVAEPGRADAGVEPALRGRGVDPPVHQDLLGQPEARPGVRHKRCVRAAKDEGHGAHAEGGAVGEDGLGWFVIYVRTAGAR